MVLPLLARGLRLRRPFFARRPDPRLLSALQQLIRVVAGDHGPRNGVVFALPVVPLEAVRVLLPDRGKRFVARALDRAHGDIDAGLHLGPGVLQDGGHFAALSRR